MNGQQLVNRAATESPDKLAPKRAKSVREHLVDLNATQAAIRAGYSEKSARPIGHENLTKPDIAFAIDEAMAEEAGITRRRIVDELTKIGFANMLDYVTIDKDGQAFVDLSALDRDHAAAIQEIIVEEYTALR